MFTGKAKTRKHLNVSTSSYPILNVIILMGIRKPEPLKESLADFWSRRIDDSNRLVYVVDDNKLIIISYRYHYEK